MTTTPPQEWAFPATAFGKTFTITLKASRYRSTHRPAILMYSDIDGTPGEMFGSLTINDDHVFLFDEERGLIIHHDVPQEIVDAVIRSGLIEDEPAQVVAVGMSRNAVYDLSDSGFDWFNSVVDDAA